MKIQYKNSINGVKFTTILLESHFEITFSNLGASVFKIIFPDTNNKCENILIIPSEKNWILNRTFAGAMIGPLAGRYDSQDTKLEINRPPYHFHGGSNGWDTLLWRQTVKQTTEYTIVKFFHETIEYHACISYKINKKQELVMETTVNPKTDIYMNPTNHMYFNLNGNPFIPITNHMFKLDSSSIYSESNGLLQKECLEKVSATNDFRQLSLLEKIKNNGLNLTYNFSKNKSGFLYLPENGRQIHFETTLPSVVIYTFNIEQAIFSKEDKIFQKYSAITFETQYPSNDLELVRFNASNPYFARTKYSFSVFDSAKQI